MEWSKFENYFHFSWHNKIKSFIISAECDAIFAELKKRKKEGVIIAPSFLNVFNAFKLTNLDGLKVIIVLQDPYYKLIDGKPICDGLAMSCSITGKLQPSLKNFYEGLINEFDPLRENSYYLNPDLGYLAEQGVLMLNVALTVEANKAGSHLELWKPFTKYLFENIFAYSGLPIVFLGKDAQVYEQYTGLFDDVYKLSHPVSASYNNTVWQTNGVFKTISETIKLQNNYQIEWLQLKK